MDTIYITDEHQHIIFSPKQKDNRCHPRHAIHQPCILELENGQIYVGHAQNISLTGMYITTQKKPLENLKGIKALVSLTLPNESLGFFCEITRTDHHGVAIRVKHSWGRQRNSVTMQIINEICKGSIH
ncbi:MAG: PilZ domain-containing protein [Magnetococcus sp. DMHC-6]